MVIRTRKAPRADAACHSADVLTPTERAAESHELRPFARPDELVYRDHAMCWGDDPKIRNVLLKLRGKRCT
jgi:hypothetical protein